MGEKGMAVVDDEGDFVVGGVGTLTPWGCWRLLRPHRRLRLTLCRQLNGREGYGG